MNKQTSNIAKAMTVLPRFMRYFSGSFKPKLDITIKKNEMRTLFEIDMHPNLPMKHYADTVDIELGSFTYLADKLEKKGLIKRVHSDSDKRIIVLNLTSAGKEISKKVKDNFDEHISELISTMDNEDLEKLSKAASLLEDVLSKLEN